jgi:hypothetical protein
LKPLEPLVVVPRSWGRVSRDCGETRGLGDGGDWEMGRLGDWEMGRLGGLGRKKAFFSLGPLLLKQETN